MDDKQYGEFMNALANVNSTIKNMLEEANDIDKRIYGDKRFCYELGCINQISMESEITKCGHHIHLS